MVNEITLHAEAAGGCGSYEYRWEESSGALLGVTDKLIVDKPGGYTVTVSGLNGCSTSKSIVVYQDITAPTADAGPDQLLTCLVTSVTLNGSADGGTAPYTYSWANSAGDIVGTSKDVCVSTADTYTFRVTGDNGCLARDTVTVSENVDPPIADAGPDQLLTCLVTSVTLSGSASAGSPPYTYSWANSAGDIVGTSKDVCVDTPDTYTLRVTGDNGCSNRDTVTVSEDVDPPIADAGADQLLSCLVTSVTLSGSASSGVEPYEYLWSDPQGNAISTERQVDVDKPGTYTLTVTGSNGCSTEDSVAVDQDIEAPVVDVGPDRELTCLVHEVTLSASASGGKQPYIYIWRDEKKEILSMGKELLVHEPGAYIITVVGSNGCCGSDKINVLENNAQPDVSAGPNKILTCSNPEATLDADVSGGQAPYQIEWINDCGEIVATTEDIIVTLPGVYTIFVTAANGCAASDEVTVSDGMVAPQVDAGPDKLLTCEEDELILDATVWGGASPYTYRWTNACGAVVGASENLTVSLPSVYTLTVTTADGCVGSDSVIVEKEK